MEVINKIRNNIDFEVVKNDKHYIILSKDLYDELIKIGDNFFGFEILVDMKKEDFIGIINK